MKSTNRLHFKTYFFVALMVLFGPLGNVLLGKGMKQIGSASFWTFSELPHIFPRIFSTPAIWMGVASLIVFLIANMLVLSWADYSYVTPTGSVAYLVVALLSYFLLGERIAPLQWLGIGIICVGVFVVGNTPPSTTGEI